MATGKILSSRPAANGGLKVDVLYECGHEQQVWFPHAPKRASRQEISGWVFGSRQHISDRLCSRCVREAETATA